MILAGRTYLSFVFVCLQFVGLMVGLVFLQVQDDPVAKRVQNIVGAIFIILVENSFVAALGVAQVRQSQDAVLCGIPLKKSSVRQMALETT